jgi:hypothetical protein
MTRALAHLDTVHPIEKRPRTEGSPCGAWPLRLRRGRLAEEWRLQPNAFHPWLPALAAAGQLLGVHQKRLHLRQRPFRVTA